jgi:hypothetical protein
VPNLSLNEPVVCHAVVALSSLHEHRNKLADISSQQTDRQVALREYGKAMSLMRAWQTPPTQDSMVLPLAVCLLFVCIEFLLGDEATSHLHIRQGRKLLSEMAKSRTLASHTMATVKYVLVPLYTRLSLASYTMGSNPEPIPIKFKDSWTTATPPTSRDGERQALFELTDAGFHLGFEARPVVNASDPDRTQLRRLSATQANLLSALRQWHKNFTSSKLSPLRSQPEAAEEPDRSFLLLLYNVMFVWISTALTPQETAYDVYLYSFRAVTRLASSILSAWTTNTADMGAFVFESELIPALYWVATKCRHASVRRDALQLLLHPLLLARRENLWDARESNRVALRIVEVEEWHSMRRRRNTTDMDEDGPIPLSVTASASETVAVIKKTAGVAGSNAQSSNEARRSNEVVEVDSEEPYGIPESCRVKFGVVGPRDNSGTWLTIYMAAKESGPGQWRSGKEYVRWT